MNEASHDHVDDENEVLEFKVHHHSPHTAEHLGSRLKLAIALNGIIIIAQIIGGIAANSLALLSDAGHNFTDLAALFLSFYAITLSLRPASPQRTFGFHRSGIFVAMINSVTLLLITVYIFYEAYQRIIDPPSVEGGLMIVVAAVAFAANLWIALMLKTHIHDNINMRSAFLHMIGDALASIGVVAAGLILMYTGWPYADPLISIVIGVIIAYGAWKIVEESAHILLEGTPRNIDTNQVIEAMNGVKGVVDVHDFHLWTIGPQVNSLSCHILIEDQTVSSSENILRKVNELLLSEFGISHTTIQLEISSCDPDALYCTLIPTSDPHLHHGHNH